MIDRVVAGAVFRAAPLALALVVAAAGLELIDTSTQPSAAAVLGAGTRALENVGYLVPLLAAVIGITSVRSRRMWLSLSLMGVSHKRMLASAVSAALLLSAAFGACLVALPDAELAQPGPRPQRVKGGWIVPFAAGAQRVDLDAMRVEPAHRPPPPQSPPGSGRRLAAWVVALTLLGFLPLFVLEPEWHTDRIRGQATMVFVAVAGGGALVLAVRNLAVDAARVDGLDATLALAATLVLAAVLAVATAQIRGAHR